MVFLAGSSASPAAPALLHTSSAAAARESGVTERALGRQGTQKALIGQFPSFPRARLAIGVPSLQGRAPTCRVRRADRARAHFTDCGARQRRRCLQGLMKGARRGACTAHNAPEVAGVTTGPPYRAALLCRR